MIPEKECLDCSKKTLTFAVNPRCRSCTQKKCVYRNLRDSINRQTCNHMVDLIFRDNCYICIGHYKMLQKYCRCCGVHKRSNDTLSYDDWFYCDEHKPAVEYRNKLVTDILMPFLNADVVTQIIGLI
jgi:hypothetical protein